MAMEQDPNNPEAGEAGNSKDLVTPTGIGVPSDVIDLDDAARAAAQLIADARVDGAACVAARLQSFCTSLELSGADRVALVAARGALEIAQNAKGNLERTARLARAVRRG